MDLILALAEARGKQLKQDAPEFLEDLPDPLSAFTTQESKPYQLNIEDLPQDLIQIYDINRSFKSTTVAVLDKVDGPSLNQN